MKKKLKKLKKINDKINNYKSKLELLQREYGEINKECHLETEPIYMISKDKVSIIKITGHCIYEGREGRTFESISYFNLDGVFRESSSWFLTSITRDYDEKPKKECFRLFKKHIKNEETKKLMFFNKNMKKAKKYIKKL